MNPKAQPAEILVDRMIDLEAELIVDNIESATQVRWISEANRETAIRNVRDGLYHFLNRFKVLQQ